MEKSLLYNSCLSVLNCDIWTEDYIYMCIYRCYYIYMFSFVITIFFILCMFLSNYILIFHTFSWCSYFYNKLGILFCSSPCRNHKEFMIRDATKILFACFIIEPLRDIVNCINCRYNRKQEVLWGRNHYLECIW